MNGKQDISAALQTAAESLTAHAAGVGITAYNIANISTCGFAPAKIGYATGPDGVGVKSRAAYAHHEKTEPHIPEEGHLCSSGTDLAKEISSLILTQRAFEANATVIKTVDDSLGIILDTKA